MRLLIMSMLITDELWEVLMPVLEFPKTSPYCLPRATGDPTPRLGSGARCADTKEDGVPSAPLPGWEMSASHFSNFAILGCVMIALRHLSC